MPLDPGLLQFTAAVRTSVATVISALIIVPLLHRLGQPVIEASPAVMFVMLCMLFTRDLTLPRRMGTVTLAFLAGAGGFAAAAALARWPVLDIGGFLALLGVATLFQTRGPRVVAIGLSVLIGYYLGVFLHPPLASQLTILVLMVPALLVCLAMLRLLPDSPENVVHLMLASIAAQADRVVREARHPQQDPRRLERHLLKLNRAVIAAQAQLTLSDLPGYAATVNALINLEIAVTHAVLHVEAAETEGVTAEWRTALTGLMRAAAEMGRRPNAAAVAAAAPAVPTPPLAWRSTLRAICAAVIATCFAYPLSPEHWYWAIISVFVISLGTSSAGDTVQKGTLRVAGTAGGALAGMIVAALVPAHPAAVVVGMIVCLFGWSYFVLYNYAFGIFFLTLLIGLVYGVLGDNLPAIVGLRLAETAIGAAATFVTALWIVPLPTSHHIRARALTLIARLLDVVDVSHAALAEGSGAAPLVAMRRADQAMQELRMALLPLHAARLISLVPRQDALPSVLICIHWVRVLAVAAASEPTLLPDDRDALLDRLVRLRDHIAALATTGVSAVAEAPPRSLSGAVSAGLIAEAADRIEAALRGLFGRIGATPREFAAALLG
ncbi:MAG: FUSC family protein [Pseudorhodoplanes sp.]